MHFLVTEVITLRESLGKCKARTFATIAGVWHLVITRNLACPILIALHRGSSCMTSNEAARERDRNRRARLASAAAPRPTGHSSAARPAAALAAEAARAAAQTTAHGQVIQDNTRVYQRARAIGDTAVVPAHSAEQFETAPGPSPAARARSTSSTAASGSRSRTAADDVADTSGSTSGSAYAPSSADGAPEPGGAAGDSPRAGGASNLAAVRFYRTSGPAGRHI
jgi:hypothetical protein